MILSVFSIYTVKQKPLHRFIFAITLLKLMVTEKQISHVIKITRLC